MSIKVNEPMRTTTQRGTCAALVVALAALALLAATAGTATAQEKTEKPPLHAQSWMVITGKPLAATAGAMTFQRGGNAVDASCAMIAATATMWDTLSWGGETQALVWHPRERRVIAINALGVAPSGATVEFFRKQGMKYPPEYGPLAAVTPGTPGGLLVMLAEYGKLSLAEVLAPAIELADGYPIEAELANRIERDKRVFKAWPDTVRVMLPHAGEAREAPRAGEMFRQPDLAATLRRLVEAERAALKRGASRKAAIMAAYERFYRGDIGAEFAAAVQAQGGLITASDLANWQVKIEAPRQTNYRGIDVYKLDTWVQGPVMLQALNILENFDLRAMGYNSTRYLHTLYQAMNLAFADRDFYYGDPAFPPAEPIRGLLSKDYAKTRAALIGERNDPAIGPGDPYPFQGEYESVRGASGRERLAAPPERAAVVATRRRGRALHARRRAPAGAMTGRPGGRHQRRESRRRPSCRRRRDRAGSHFDSPHGADDPFCRGTTSVVAADKAGWVVAVTPSGGWVPAVIAGHTGIGLSQRMQSFVLDPADESVQRARARQAPAGHADAEPRDEGRQALARLRRAGRRLAGPEPAAVLPERGRVRHDAAAGRRSGQHEQLPAATIRSATTAERRAGCWSTRPCRAGCAAELQRQCGYRLEFRAADVRTDQRDHGRRRKHGTLWGASSNHGEDYGIGWGGKAGSP